MSDWSMNMTVRKSVSFTDSVFENNDFLMQVRILKTSIVQ